MTSESENSIQIMPSTHEHILSMRSECLKGYMLLLIPVRQTL